MKVGKALGTTAWENAVLLLQQQCIAQNPSLESDTMHYYYFSYNQKSTNDRGVELRLSFDVSAWHWLDLDWILWWILWPLCRILGNGRAKRLARVDPVKKFRLVRLDYFGANLV